jgi:DNA-binding beta-propeller fold protein YncE
MIFSRSQTIRGLTLLALLIGHHSLLAQTLRWNAPSTVFVHDSVGKTIRPLVGIVGSSYPGPVLLDGVEWASFALNQKSALVSRGGVLAWIPDLSAPDLTANFTAYILLGVPLPQQVIWAAGSTQAAVVVAGVPRVVWLGACDGAPRLDASWDLDASQTNWSLLAADSSANQVLLASQEGDLWRLWLASPTKPPALIAGVTQPAAAVFAQSGTIAFVADAAAHQVVQIGGLNSSPVVAPIVVSATYVADPVGLALSKDGSRLFLADGAGKMIRVFQTGTGVLSAELPLQTAPRSLTASSSNSFLIGGRDQKDQPFYFLDTRADGRVSFVPVGQ